jgi:uncharacterized membrane protein YphA (DoxX/SURF4 family)
MARTFLVGRILAGGYYLFSAWHHFADLGNLSRYAGMHGVPAPTLAVLVAGVLLLVGGLSILLGVFPPLGVAALVLFFVPVTLTMHAFWTVHDPLLRTNDFINFTKNIALLGYTLMLLAEPRPWPYSLERRLRRPVRAAV